MQDLLYPFFIFLRAVLITMIKIVFCAILTGICFFIVKMYAKKGVRSAKEKEWAGAKNAFVIAFCALALMAVLEVIHFFDWVFYTIFGVVI